MDPREILSEIKLELKRLNLLPGEIELSRFLDYYFSNIKLKSFEGLISESVVCGFDQNPEVALLKSFSEYIESLSFQEGHKKSLPSCLTERSDGFAAFPKLAESYKHQARERALAEAIERFVWAQWWDHPENGFDLEEINFREGPETQQAALLRELSKFIEIESAVCVAPHFSAPQGLRTAIFIAFLKSGGVISGGACGPSSGSTQIRVIAELIRHGLAAQRFRSTKVHPVSFYEKRLCYFLGPEGETAVHRRLAIRGQDLIQLPALQIDTEVPSMAPDCFYVHRCLFENQPPFIGGALERFCL